MDICTLYLVMAFRATDDGIWSYVLVLASMCG